MPGAFDMFFDQRRGRSRSEAQPSLVAVFPFRLGGSSGGLRARAAAEGHEARNDQQPMAATPLVEG
jgi:hypothetical protein